jgi:hypothetical protein
MSFKDTNPPLSDGKVTLPDQVEVVDVDVVAGVAVEVVVSVLGVEVLLGMVVVVVVFDMAATELEGAPGPVGENFKLGKEIMMGPVVAKPSKSYHCCEGFDDGDGYCFLFVCLMMMMMIFFLNGKLYMNM